MFFFVPLQNRPHYPKVGKMIRRTDPMISDFEDPQLR